MFKTIWYIEDKDDNFNKALGLISSRFSILEELIIGSINVMVGGEGASILTAGIPFSRLLTILSSLYKQKYSLTTEKGIQVMFEQLLTQAKNAEDNRNRILHSMWQKSKIPGEMNRTKRSLDRKKGLRIDNETVSINNLYDVADIIKNAVELALEFYYRVLTRYVSFLVSPHDQEKVSVKPEFTWTPVEGAVAYELTISGNPDFTKLVVSKRESNAIKDTNYTCETPLQRNVTYYWRVQPVIATENGYWSEIRSFIIE